MEYPGIPLKDTRLTGEGEGTASSDVPENIVRSVSLLVDTVSESSAIFACPRIP